MGIYDHDHLPLNEYLGFAIKKWYIFLISLALCTAVAILVIKATQPVYQVRAKIHLDSGDSNAKNEVLMKEMEFFEAGTSISDQISIISSNTLIEKVIDQMNVGITYYETADFRKVVDPKFSPFNLIVDSTHIQPVEHDINVIANDDGTFAVSVKAEEVTMYLLEKDELLREVEMPAFEGVAKNDEWIETKHFKFKLQKNPEWELFEGNEYACVINSKFNLIKDFQEKVDIQPISDKSNIVEMVAEGSLIHQEKTFLNTIMDTYIKDRVEKKVAHAMETLNFIDQAIAAANDTLKQNEKSLESFRANSNIIDVEATSSLLKEQQLKLEEKSDDLALKIQNYRDILNVLNTQKDKTDAMAPTAQQIGDIFLQNLLLTLADLQRQKAIDELTAISTSKQIQQLDVQINSTVATITDHVNSTLISLRKERNLIVSRLGKTNSELARIPVNEKRLNKIERNSEFADENYKYLVQRRAEAALALSSEDTETYIVDEAELVSNKPVSPNKLIIFCFAFIIGITLPILGKVSYDLLNNKVMSRRDLELSTDIPVLGMVVKSDLWNRVVSPNTSQTRLAESFRSARIQLNYLFSKDEENPKKVIGFTSSSPNEGKSFCAANFASTLALSGKKTVLVDLDLRKPDQKEYFTYDNSVGLHGYLTGSYRYTDILTKIQNIDNLWIFPSGPAFHNSLDLLDSKKFTRLVSSLRKRFDYVIFDTPPIGHTSDYYIIKDMVDFTVYVVRHNLTSIKALELVNQLYQDNSLGDMGILVNGVKDVEEYNYGQGTSYSYSKNGYQYSAQNGSSKNLKDRFLEKIWK